MKDNKRKKKRWSPWLSLIMVGGIPVAGILLLAALPLLRPQLPRANYDDVTWTTYKNKMPGFSLDVPQSYEVNKSSDGIDMAFEGEVIVVITHLTEEEADERGLWADHDSAGEIQLGGVKGKKYRYGHFDALFGVFTVSHVVPWREKYLALEFRTRRMSIYEDIGFIKTSVDRDLNRVELRMVESFRFPD